jgi:hypothetical protein
VAGVITALFAPCARLYEIKAAFGVVIVCVAFAATMDVMMATTVAKRMTLSRENFWIRIVIALILFGFPLGWVSYVWVQVGSQAIAPGGVPAKTQSTNVFSAAEDSLKRRVTQSAALLLNPASGCQASLFDL